MSADALPPSVRRLLWDIDPDALDLHRDRAFVLSRVMSRGTWEAMLWLRATYSREVMAEFLRSPMARTLSPRDRAYWSLLAGVAAASSAGGGRPAWAGW